MRRSTGLNLFVAGALALPLAAQTAAEALGGGLGRVSACGPHPRHRRRRLSALGGRQRRAVIVQVLPPGPHKIRVQLVNANHKPIDQGIVEVTVPDVSTHAEAR